MIRQIYIEFIESFGELNHYELGHFCKELYQQCKIVGNVLDKNNKITLTASDLQEIIIQSVHAIQVEFAEKKLLEAELNLKRVKGKISKDNPR
ncbi:MAG: hypothetical protein ABL857_03135 [Rickettsiales bacterium]